MNSRNELENFMKIAFQLYEKARIIIPNMKPAPILDPFQLLFIQRDQIPAIKEFLYHLDYDESNRELKLGLGDSNVVLYARYIVMIDEQLNYLQFINW